MEMRGSVLNSLASCYAQRLDMFLCWLSDPFSAPVSSRPGFKSPEKFCVYKPGRIDGTLE